MSASYLFWQKGKELFERKVKIILFRRPVLTCSEATALPPSSTPSLQPARLMNFSPGGENDEISAHSYPGLLLSPPGFLHAPATANTYVPAPSPYYRMAP